MGPAPIHSRGRVEVRWGRVMDLRVVAFAIVAIVAIVGWQPLHTGGRWPSASSAIDAKCDSASITVYFTI